MSSRVTRVTLSPGSVTLPLEGPVDDAGQDGHLVVGGDAPPPLASTCDGVTGRSASVDPAGEDEADRHVTVVTSPEGRR